MTTEPAYRRYPRARLRSFLEAIEDHLRGETGQPQLERMGFPIEHILPQRWADSWPVEGPAAQQDRQEHVHRLGNLTLLTQGLNSKVSNGPWPSKRSTLLKNNTIKLTGRLIEETEDSSWNEAHIDQRNTEMIDPLLKVWPVPRSHRGEVVDPQTKAQDWVQIKHLIEGKLLLPGAKLIANQGEFKGLEATVTADGFIELEGRRFDTPSGAARHLRKAAANGWYFWTVADGRRLRDVRAEFLGATPAAATRRLTTDSSIEPT